MYCHVWINDGIIIEMGDDGISISKEMRHTIFEPFVVSESVRDNGQGTFFNIEFSRLD